MSHCQSNLHIKVYRSIKSLCTKTSFFPLVLNVCVALKVLYELDLEYSASIPNLDCLLDWDNSGVDQDLCEIASQMRGWEEKYSTDLRLTDIDIDDIKDT